MGSADQATLFDADYYATSCGRPYGRDAEWFAFFGSIAEHIIQQLHPSTVLDAGCAWGLLVEVLRKGGVEAFGIDISPYAIQNVQPAVQPYCWVGSITEPFPRKYDLIVTIEVLEHLYPDQAELAVANLCRYTDDVLFSSTPLDRAEKTHFNVQRPEYWAALFARQGFFRDANFDASFITPWAVRFRREPKSVQDLVSAYERQVWHLTQENRHYRELSLRQSEQLRGWQERWAGLEKGIGWPILQRLQKWRAHLAPAGSKREQLLEAFSRAAGLSLRSSQYNKQDKECE